MGKSELSVGQQISSLWNLGDLSWRELARRVWGGINQNDLTNRGYQLAYNFLLSVFPMLLFLLALFGFFASTGSKLRQDLFSYLQLALPPSAYQLVSNITNQIAIGASGSKLIFGLLLALYSGSGGMTQLIATLNAAYEVRERRSWIRVYLISLGLTLAMFRIAPSAPCQRSAGLLDHRHGRARQKGSQAIAPTCRWKVRLVPCPNRPISMPSPPRRAW